ncbi:MAG: GntR family transcriptional regulator [Actinobacteria bacterium]|nr:GntR family transcriptional regulator [Actinomycetota bacterium]
MPETPISAAVTAEPDDRGRSEIADVRDILSPTDTVQLSDAVVDRLREAILRGAFAPGDRLPEEQLAEALGVSRGPVRQALALLEREGMVVRRRNRGAIVARLSREDLNEVFSLRVVIEPVACEWAAANADERDIERLRTIVDGYSRLTSDLTVQRAAEVDLGFHDAIYDAARHRRLLRMWADLRPQVFVFMLGRTYVHTSEWRTMMIENHRSILDAVVDRDGARARELAKTHVQISYEHVLEVYDSDDTDDAAA